MQALLFYVSFKKYNSKTGYSHSPKLFTKAHFDGQGVLLQSEIQNVAFHLVTCEDSTQTSRLQHLNVIEWFFNL